MHERPLWQRFLGLWLALAWLAGVVLAAWWPQPMPTWLALTLGSVLFGLLVRRVHIRFVSPRLSPVLSWLPALFLGAAALSLGAARWTWAHRPHPETQRLQQLAQQGTYVRAIGTVIQPPRWKEDRLRVVVALEYVRSPIYGPAQPVRGKVLVTWPRAQAPQVAYGDRVVLRGRLRPPPTWEDFDYRAYLARRGIYALMYAPRVGVLAQGRGNPLLAAIFRLRERAREQVHRLWPDPEAGFFAGVLLGLDDDIPEPVYAAFRDTGTAHVIVISGFNIAVLSALFLGLFRRWMPWPWAAAVTGLLIAGYTVLVGADAAVVRAAIMGGLSLLARHLGRRQHGLTTLAVTAALMSAWWPDVLWDVAFQLSFAATLGLILYGTALVEGFESLLSRWLPQPVVHRLSGPVGEFLLLTLAAQWTTLPVIVWHFGTLSLIAPLANVLILPFQTPLMVLGGLAVALALVAPPLGEPLAWLAWPWTAYTIRVVEALAAWPWAAVPVARTWVLPLHAGVWLLVELYRWRPALPLALPVPRPSRWAWLGGLWALNALLAARQDRLPDGWLHLWLLPAGGETAALLLQDPTGAYLLFNGGAQGTRLNDQLGRILGRSTPMTWWVVTEDRDASLEALLAAWERYPPERLLWVPRAVRSPVGRRLRAWAREAQRPWVTPPPQAWLQLAQGGRVAVLDRSPSLGTLRLVWGAFTLGMGDPGAWPPAFGPPLVWVVGEPCGFLLFPTRDPTTRQWTQGQPLPCRRHGWLHLRTDGQRLWLESQR